MQRIRIPVCQVDSAGNVVKMFSTDEAWKAISGLGKFLLLDVDPLCNCLYENVVGNNEQWQVSSNPDQFNLDSAQILVVKELHWT